MAFHLDEARERGLTRAQLLGRRWRRLGPRVYASREASDDPLLALKAALLRLPGTAVFSGRTAAHLHGLEPQCAVIEATLPVPTTTSGLVGIRIRRCMLEPEDVVLRAGLRVTSPLRTMMDLCGQLELIEAVAYLDAALHRKLFRLDDLKPRPGSRGVKRLRRAIELAEPATESPMETRLRMLLVLAGLPRPVVQVSLYDAKGIFVGRPDLYYPDSRLAIEYDGAVHRTSLVADNRRQNRIVEAGYRVLRFSAADVFQDGSSVVSTVRQALHV